MNEDHPKRILQLDHEVLLRMKMLGFSIETMAAYYGLSDILFMREVEKVPLLKAILK